MIPRNRTNVALIVLTGSYSPAGSSERLPLSRSNQLINIHFNKTYVTPFQRDKELVTTSFTFFLTVNQLVELELLWLTSAFHSLYLKQEETHTTPEVTVVKHSALLDNSTIAFYSQFY